MKIYKCECHTEGFSIDYDPECGVFLSGWQLSPGKGPMSFYNRLRWVWHILTTGQPFNDHVILSKETAKEIASDLLMLLEDETCA